MINRFKAVDQTGVEHTVVERAREIRTFDRTLSANVKTTAGPTVFHSARTGDVLVEHPDGTLQTADGHLRLTRC
ncbi:hypothetical protein J7E62_02700 [Variovorax paradoxus]|nr:hypothetical protein [Variovorax paradoxus]